MTGTLLKRVIEAKNIETFLFTLDRPMRYTAGQFSEVILPHKGADKRGQKRWFTLSSAPSEDTISITTKFALKDGSTFKTTLHDLELGDQVHISDAMGDFVLPRDVSIPLVFIAGGIGVTPMRSMTQFIKDSDLKHKITTYYAVNSLDDVAFKSLLSEYTDLHIIAKESSGNQSEPQRLTGELIVQDKPSNAHYYIAGPDGMVTGIVSELLSLDINKKNIISDFFPGY